MSPLYVFFPNLQTTPTPHPFFLNKVKLIAANPTFLKIVFLAYVQHALNVRNKYNNPLQTKVFIIIFNFTVIYPTN